MISRSNETTSRTEAFRVANDTARPPPAPTKLVDNFRPPKPVGETPSSSEVLAKVAERAQAIPPREDSLALSAAAARYSLTSLDSAKQIAREIRESMEKKPAESGDAASSSPRRPEIADALLG